MPRQPATAPPGTGGSETQVRSDFDPLSAALKQPWIQHFGALAVFTALLVIRWWKYFTWPMPLNDEMTYFRAANALLHGGSAYQPGYLYPLFPAYVSALAIRAVGVDGWTFALRLLNDLGAAAMTWLSVSWLPWAWWRRLTLGSVLILLSPAVHFGIFTANLSLAIGGLLAAALLLWPTAPVISGAILGLSIGIKPLAPGAIAALALHRPERARRKNAWLAAGIGCAAGIGLLISFPDSLHLLHLPLDQIDPMSRTVSLHRIAHLLGWNAHPALVSSVLLLVALWLTRRRPLNLSELYGAATATALATTPIVWSHTMIITLPIQVVAVTRGIYRVRDADDGPAVRRRRYELIFVLLGCAAIQFAEGASAVYHVSALWQALAVALPALAPAALTAYLVHTRRTELSHGDDHGHEKAP